MEQSVNLPSLLEAVRNAPDGVTMFLHRKTGEVLRISDDVLRRAQLQAPDARDDEEFRAAARVVAATEDDYLPLPNRLEVDESALMEAFVRELSNPMMRTMLARELTGTGRMRRFQDRVVELGLQEDWNAYRLEGYLEFMRQWCRARSVPYFE
ncbi:UPF0158 family protein [Salibacterium qingdaonense]|uniref:Uncharacterized protein family (UPF0158) n=1 Tax=Salibacterium qingdaonense TaxID=266892 RepID=A0A1I4LIX5_9BACI|nr:UPF0158 family protein [Salibacterium qingdaonense]SFL90994.1 Uncharacterised protein family (UPF0158) [Salibacterium qingdaonense]